MSNINSELIIKYLDNSISESDEAVLLEWLKASEENRDIFLTCKKIFALGKVKHYSDHLHLNLALQSVNDRIHSGQRIKRLEFVYKVSKYAAVFLLILAIPAFLWFISREKPVEFATASVDSIEPVKTLILPDGSKVWINNRSSVTYPLSFTKKEREITLDGEAYFEVKTDSMHPFIVKTYNMQVRVYGTSFNVNTHTEDNSVKTTLVSGHIGIRDAAGHNLAMVSPGQMASFNIKNKKIELYQVNTDLYTRWRKGFEVFDKASLTEITSKIEELYNVNIIINTSNPVQNKINFVFQRSQPLDTVLDMLKFVIPINYKIYNDQVYINLK